jgi:hypothetical protein
MTRCSKMLHVSKTLFVLYEIKEARPREVEVVRFLTTILTIDKLEIRCRTQRYTGTDLKQAADQWIGKMNRKMSEGYPTEKHKIIYISTRVTKYALDRMEPRLDDESELHYTTTDDVWAHIRQLFGDPDKLSKKKAEFKVCYQHETGETFHQFFGRFSKLFLEARTHNDEMLRELHERILDTLASEVLAYYVTDPTIPEYVAHTTRIDNRMRTIASRGKRAYQTEAPYSPKPYSPKPPQTPSPAGAGFTSNSYPRKSLPSTYTPKVTTMVVTPKSTPASALPDTRYGSTKDAQGKVVYNDKARQSRQERGECYKCGIFGHHSRRPSSQRQLGTIIALASAIELSQVYQMELLQQFCWNLTKNYRSGDPSPIRQRRCNRQSLITPSMTKRCWR